MAHLSKKLLFLLFFAILIFGQNVVAEELIGTPNAIQRESGLAATIEKSINKDCAFRFDVDYRSLDGDLYFKFYEASLVRYFKNKLSVRLTHRWYYLHRAQDADWKLGNMSHVRLSKTFETKLIDYNFRFAHEYFFGNIQGNQHRSRLKVSIKPHKKIYSFKPFITNEIFYRHQNARASRNWVSTGLEYYHNESTKYFLYHRYETFEDPNDKNIWNSGHGAFAGLVYKF